MNNLIPFDNAKLQPSKEKLNYIMSIVTKDKSITREKILKKSALTKTQTLRALETLISSNKILYSQVGRIFYLVE